MTRQTSAGDVAAVLNKVARFLGLFLLVIAALALVIFSAIYLCSFLQRFDTVGWVTGRTAIRENSLLRLFPLFFFGGGGG